jgi:hypothetical protein
MEPTAYSIPEFCDAHRISRAHYFNLQKAGEGPRVMHVGARVIISREAAADWRRQRELVAEREQSAA